MLNLYRRHVTKCPFKTLGVAHTQCSCPVWVDGEHPATGERVRRSVGTKDWSRAKRLLDRWESDARSIDAPEKNHPTIPDALKIYLADCQRRKLGKGTVRNYQNSLDHFRELTAHIPDVSELSVGAIRDFSQSRSKAPGRRGEFTSSRTLRKELEHMRAFCEFAVDNNWIPKNPARKVKPPKDDSKPTLPFSPDEVKRLLAAVDLINNHNFAGVARAKLRARGLVMLLLYSGLRITDAVILRRDRIDKDGRLLVRMEKTNEPLYVRLPADAMQALKAMPVEGDYFFWSGKCAIDTAVGSARRTITCLSKHTGINAHPHRFRDTFSVELLKSGADLRTVQKLLGHTSIKTTERHYSPWVLAFQKQLDKATAKLRFG